METNALILPTKSSEGGGETPPRRIQPMSCTNGVLKRHKNHRNTVVPSVAYMECLKNHAASSGGHALDGCGEFMPAPTATSDDPTSLRCAACGCHRNFHRREPEELGVAVGGGFPTTPTRVVEYHPHHRHHPLPPPACRVESPGSDNNTPLLISSTYYPGSGPHMLLALSSGGDDDTANKNPTTAHGAIELEQHKIFGTSPQMGIRKRHRTKFSQEQKLKMYEFAEKVGWRLMKSNEEAMNVLCNEIGVERGVFKVWMHNNKNTLGKRSAPDNHHNHGGVSINDMNDPIEEDDKHKLVINGGNGVVVAGNSLSHSSSISNNNNAVPANASSCSS